MAPTGPAGAGSGPPAGFVPRPGPDRTGAYGTLAS